MLLGNIVNRKGSGERVFLGSSTFCVELTISRRHLESTPMQSNEIFALGLVLAPPWNLMEQQLDTLKKPYELHLRLAADRGALHLCPECGKSCKAHDFKAMTWRHLNFFQHHCSITAPVPRISFLEHGVKRISVLWVREGRPLLCSSNRELYHGCAPTNQ